MVADKVREAVARHSFADADGALGHELTISAGVASFQSGCSDRDGLLRQADEALYQAKSHGRNTVVLSGEDACPPLGKKQSASPL